MHRVSFRNSGIPCGRIRWVLLCSKVSPSLKKTGFISCQPWFLFFHFAEDNDYDVLV